MAVSRKFTDQHCSSSGIALYCNAVFYGFEYRQGKVFFYMVAQLN